MQAILYTGNLRLNICVVKNILSMV